MNEQAFPNPHRTDLTGMTLRDYFAAKAMQGFLATVKVDCSDDLIAKDSYNLADAMLKERDE